MAQAAIRVHPQVSANATGPGGPDGELRESSMMRAEVWVRSRETGAQLPEGRPVHLRAAKDRCLGTNLAHSPPQNATTQHHRAPV